MSNKVKIKADEARTQVGNFIIRKIDTGNERFELKNTASNFKLDIHLNHPSYDMIEGALELNPTYLHMWLNVLWMYITGVKDKDFFKDFKVIYLAQAKRLNPEVELSQEEDDAILKEEQQKHEIQEQLDAVNAIEANIPNINEDETKKEDSNE